MKKTTPDSRRNFIGTLTAGAIGGSLAAISSPLLAASPLNSKLAGDADEWLKLNIKGEHRIVYDGPEPHNAFPLIWTWAYYLTNNTSGTEDDDMTAVCVLRHNAIPFAMADGLWSKYKFGEVFHINDNTTQAPALRNPYWEPKEGDYPMPGIDGIKRMQERGALFCVCELAISVYSANIAAGMGMDPAAVKEEWIAGVLPGVQVVPSGVWALGRAQENGCGYIYAGG
jgi:intracellular sulfur oxidation DsrE/DsrF family protein